MDFFHFHVHNINNLNGVKFKFFGEDTMVEVLTGAVVLALLGVAGVLALGWFPGWLGILCS